MDDTISRQATIDAFLTELTRRERKNLLHTWSTVEVKYFIAKMLEQLPSAQSNIARDIATIIENEKDMRVILNADGVRQSCNCSVCGKRSIRPLGDFCRWCGADMREGGEE